MLFIFLLQKLLIITILLLCATDRHKIQVWYQSKTIKKKKAESVQCVPINVFLNDQDLLNVLNVILASVQVSGVDWTKLKNKFDINWRLCDQHSVTGVNWFTLTRSCLLVSEETPVLVGFCALCSA